MFASPSLPSSVDLCSSGFLGFPRRSNQMAKIQASLHSQADVDSFERTHQEFVELIKKAPALRAAASKKLLGLTQELKQENFNNNGTGLDPFEEMRCRFLTFKNEQFLKNSERFESLAEAQVPKFMVIACADSRVCPSTILGFQPGDAFTIRNIANLVPPFENGLSETSAALEFAVNFLEVENIFIIGHSCCGGIKALMSMEEECNSSFIEGWVAIGKPAKSCIKATAVNLSFDQQCKHCEKESVNKSMLNLLTYPWIEKRVSQGKLRIHGGYYDFVDCTFEKWCLQYKASGEEGNHGSMRDHLYWC
ncbi:beta carbonic anhydrase 5, chloroplastic isoform X2 [Amborella trichopoda]|uniref:beta carbonic anhydrase 5, chloroplastic isoform X2 n=1 Tax=Amborella trichopoda TaxID=13333 RepID=UPI0009BEB9C8|nr:beta carbonic anhydrase 5, chloroplastic isoform X2 [Amborella trichopoda]|eukprot:XP_020519798.1 beta carbonic anhydrase 5, chloroplastic isoform X2 [Amborella trichopoda]